MMTGSPAMPPLDPAPVVSRFEFWPAWRFYPPVWAWLVLLAIRHRGLRLPLLANPSFPAGGLVGESKSQILDLVGGDARQWVAPYIAFDRGEDDAATAATRARAAMTAAGLSLPVVAKPDLGCRGAGVRPVRDGDQLVAYLAAFPAGHRLLLQQMVDVEGEAGVFYVRPPGAAQGHIFSLTLKHFPHVVGDGRSTLRALILADPRAGPLHHLYFHRHPDRLDLIVAAGERVRLAFAGSHSRGAIFRDGARHITPELTARFDQIARAIPEFHFGRFDVRFGDFAAFQRGEGFRIVEVNGAGAEATHIWDSRMRLRDAYRVLFTQFRWLFAIGAANRRRGFRPDRWRDFIRLWQLERRLVRLYPPTA